MEKIYLDNSATTRVYDEVVSLMAKIMTEDYGNPSSRHIKGVEAENYVKNARTELAKLLKAEPKEIFFTAGGTESNNLALIGCAEANKRAGNHIIVSSIEHPSVLETVRFLEEHGYRVTRLPVDKSGIVDMETLKKEICGETILVSVMYVNNEIGAVQPVEEIGAFLKKEYPRVIFHVDAVQAFGKYRIYPKRMGIDLLSVSAHKIHGPKGVGFLYVAGNVKIKPVMFGGGQQGGLRSGTENVPGIAGLALAARMVYDNLNDKTEKMNELKKRLTDGISDIPDVCVNGIVGEGQSCGAPHIVNISFLGVRSEVLLNALDSKGICVSAGSACSSHKQGAGNGRAGGSGIHHSDTLRAIGADEKRMDSAIRFSLSEFTTDREIDECVKALHESIPTLRRFVRK